MTKRFRKAMSIILAFMLVMSAAPGAFAAVEQGIIDETAAYFDCGMEIHVHGEDCYVPELICVKHVHDENCYGEELLADCTIPAGRDLDCDGHTAHDDSCYVTHTHTEGDCYTVESEEEIWTCTKPAGPELVCPMELHVHDEELCYVDHEHTDSCYNNVLVCEIPEHEKHIEDCLTEENKAALETVIVMMTEAPGLQEMQDARGTTFADTKTYPAEQAAADYDVYIAESFAAREAALQAYEEMPEELKAFVPAELVEKLTKELETVYDLISASIAKGEDGYNFRSIYSPAYEMSGHMVSNGDGNEIPQTLILVEADRDHNWSMSGPYISGLSNYEVLYCCDIETGYHNGIYYKRLNLEDSPYYSDEAAQHIRSIVMNSYPYVSIEQMEASLPEEFAGLTRAEAISAVQTAIWSYANGVGGQYHYSQTFDQAYASAAGWGGIVHNYNNEMYDWWNVGKRQYYNNTEAGARIDSLVEYLTAFGPTAPSDDEIIITSVEVVGEPVPVLGSGDQYEVLLKVVLNSSGSSLRDDLKITAAAGEGENRTASEEDVVFGQNVYHILVSAKAGDDITVELSGTQHVPAGVYFYEPKPADVNGDGIETAREVSQNLVGVAMGDTPVYAKTSVTFESELEIADNAELSLQKVDGEGQPLAGAEFTLYTDMDGDRKMDPVKTYAVDEQGHTDEITDLIPGIVYELKETKVPDGYEGIEGSARFEIVMDGNEAEVRMLNLPGGMSYAADKDGIEILTVVNTVPSEGDNGGDNGGGGGTTIIPDEEVPLTDQPEEPSAEIPDEEPPVEIPDEEVPLAEQPEEIEIPDEEIPLSDIPMTGDTSLIWMAVSALSGTGMFLISRKREDEE